MKTSIAALIIALISLIATIVLGTKNYRKSKKLEFLQRRDRCFQKISDLNATNSETRLTVARFTNLATNKASSPISQKHEENHIAVVAAIRTLAKTIEEGAERQDEQIQSLYSLCARCASDKHAKIIEELIEIAQISSDDMVRANKNYLSLLLILENTNPTLEVYLADMHKLEIQLAELKTKPLEIKEASN